MNREVFSVSLALLIILVAGEAAYVYVQQGRINDLQSSLTAKDSETARLNTLLKAKSSLDSRNVTIGVIAPTADDLVKVEALISLAEADINSYCRSVNRSVTFSFLIEHADSNPAVHLEKMQSLKSMGIDLVIGGAWSSQACASGTYATVNDMILISPSSTSPMPDVTKPGDNLFRLSENDVEGGPVIAEMLWSFGIKATIVIRRNDPWGEFLFNATANAFEHKGGAIISQIVYGPEDKDFSSYLKEAEAKAQEAVQRYGKEHVAVELMAFQEATNIVKEARDYPTIYDLLWFGTDGTSPSSLNQAGIIGDGIRPLEEVLEEASHLRLLSPYPAPVYSEKYKSLNDRFRDLTNGTLDFYKANWYDAAWIYAKSVLAAETTNATIIKGIVRRIAGEYFGATGLCNLDANGDRSGSDYDAWAFDSTLDPPYVRCGSFNGMTGRFIWFNDELGFTPPGP